MSPQFGDMDDDVTLRARRTEGRRGPEMDEAPADREVTLNTGTVLALFFTLALICAVFFGFGYSMGRKSAQTSAAATVDNSSPAPAATVDTANTKPTPGSVAISPVPGYMAQSEANEPNGKAATQSIKAPASTAPATTATSAVSQPRKPAAETVSDAAPAPVVRSAPPAAAPASAVVNGAVTTAPVAGATYVQIAAVSHKEDADVLLSALQRRGYKVLTRSDAGDRLIHVQIGPFSDRKQAEATRQKLLADGYNAFLK